MKIMRPIQTGQIRIEVKTVIPKTNGRGWGYGNCRTMTVYEATAEDVFKIIEQAIKKEVR